MKDYDVIICGAGPAGLTCSLALADSGLRIALLDKSHFPKDKACGGAIAAFVPKVLNTISKKHTEALQTFDAKVPVNIVRIFSPSGKYADIEFPEYGFITTRMAWDNFLFQLVNQADNVHFFPDHRVTDIRINKTTDVATILASNRLFRAKLIIGCDGTDSIVRRTLTGSIPDPDHTSLAIRAFFKNVSGIPEKTFELHYLKNLAPGYFWIFPAGNQLANIGAGALSSTIQARKLNLKEILLNAISEEPQLKNRFKDAQMTGEIKGGKLLLGSANTSLSGHCFMLCGDAASLVNPATGEGIGQAMVSGRTAGRQAVKCFENNDFSASFMKRYDHEIHKKFRGTNRKFHLYRQLITNRNGLINLAIGKASGSKFWNKLLQRLLLG